MEQIIARNLQSARIDAPVAAVDKHDTFAESSQDTQNARCLEHIPHIFCGFVFLIFIEKDIIRRTDATKIIRYARCTNNHVHAVHDEIARMRQFILRHIVFVAVKIRRLLRIQSNALINRQGQPFF